MTATLITGLPRSGTTLLCALLNKVPNTVALAEPMNPSRKTAAASIAGLKEFVTTNRASALNNGTVITKHRNGNSVDNFVQKVPFRLGLRRSSTQTGAITIDKPLSPDFRMFIKQPAWFTALGPQLILDFEILVILRNPLAVLASWQTVKMPIHKGRIPNATRFDKRLAKTLADEPDRLRRQVLIIEWALKIYATTLSANVIKYEDLIRDPATTFGTVGIECEKIEHPFHNEPLEVRYPNVDLDRLQEALWAIRDTIHVFYPKFEA